ncbi:antitoxin component YwqK of YwqJK toxin-antitoxin module [Azospirillum agricola]|uniref:toxin-antitoxin system YwqK family antitoxin n=1 Tax=Azospirillum agricola TaxID=1720247 RepID=UPI001AE448A2|nr:hypothetical protein [Azospirillum agricola]MBP2233045.1 antitoxin component YwqK of YwqJK toxin-antitoxin module [Azospirillum agricola]
MPPTNQDTPPASGFPSEPTRIETRDAEGQLLSLVTLGAGGQPDGEFVAYAPDGSVQMRMTYRDGQPDGPATIYRDGRVQTEMGYAAGRLDGEMRGYDPAGRLLSVVRYAAGRKNGRMECFTVDGALLMTAEYRDDRLDGPMLEYRPDGTLRRRALYADDRLDGEVVEFHPGGSPAERSLFRAGTVVEGPERFADPDAPGRTSLLARLIGK